MAKFHYWTTLTQADDDETSIDTTHSLINSSPATRTNTDTLLRFIMWMELSATVGTSSLPNLDWIAGATVDYLFQWDPEQDSFEVNIIDANPGTIGFVRLDRSVWTTTTTNKYVVTWQGPPAGLNVHAIRKGDGAGPAPAITAQRWVSDNHGVFDNFAGFSVLFTSRLVGRVLWASDDPPP